MRSAKTSLGFELRQRLQLSDIESLSQSRGVYGSGCANSEQELNLRTRNSLSRRVFEESPTIGFDWLGGRDSNPDNRVQSAVSYR